MKKEIIFISMLAVIAMFAIAACNQNTAGQARLPAKQIGGSDLDPKSCGDTDHGQAYDVQGTVSGEGRAGPYSDTDVCNTNWELKEYYCNGVNKKSEKVYCNQEFAPGWICVDGECVDNTTNDTTMFCTDTDGGRVYDTFGIVNGSNGTSYSNADYCLNENEVVEFSCNGYNLRFESVNCADEFGTGWTCEDGECVEPEMSDTCTDTDGGIVYDVFGTVLVYNAMNDTNYTLPDSCGGTDRLVEYYCVDGEHYNFNSIFCSGVGYTGCMDGACYYNGTNGTNGSNGTN